MNERCAQETPQAPEPEALLELVGASPQAVARHDRSAWLELFAADAVVEDPVGSAPNRRRVCGELERFYDTFIAPNEIHFDVHADFVTGTSVVRDVTIEIRSPTGLLTRVPAYILYEITSEAGRLKIARLAAHWELPRMVAQVLGNAAAGIRMMAVLGWRMLHLQGARGVIGYSRGFSGIHGRGKRILAELATAVAARNAALVSRLFEAGAGTVEFMDAGGTRPPEALLDELGGRLDLVAPISAGWTVAARFTSSMTAGILVCTFDPRSRKIRRMRVFHRETGA